MQLSKKAASFTQSNDNKIEKNLMQRLLQGALAGFVVTAQSWALVITPQKKHNTILGKLESASAVGALLGPVLGGIIACIAGYQPLFIRSAVICAFIALVFLLFLEDTNEIAANIQPKEVISSKVKVMSLMQQQLVHILFIILIIQLTREMLTLIF